MVNDPIISLDVNMLWETPELAQNLISKLDFDPDWIEQPLPPNYNENCRELTSPVMADESLQSYQDALKLVDHVDMFNIKLPKHGGLKTSFYIAELASNMNIGYTTGSMLASPIASLAAYHFAKASTSIWIEIGTSSIKGVGNPFYLREGEVTIKEAPGLGVELSSLRDYDVFK